MVQFTKVRSTRKSQQKPKKPRPDFPLFPHATKRWAKKIRGRTCYFGPWDDPDGALKKYLDEKDDLYANRTPRVAGDGLTVSELANRFLTAKRQRMDTNDLTQKTWRGYYDICERVVSEFGKRRRVDDLAPDDFARLRVVLSTGQNGTLVSPVTFGQRVRLVKILFKYAYDKKLIDRPVHDDPDFKGPSKRRMGEARQDRGLQMFEADELRTMLNTAKQPMKVMILLACNGGMGQTDLANLPKSAVDFDAGWLNYPRPKTAVERRIPLWTETVQALREAIAMRPAAKKCVDDGMCFLTTYGNRWTGNSGAENNGWVDSLGSAFRKLRRKANVAGKRGFYCLRRTFEIIAGESCDQVSVNAIMGHSDSSMAGVYRQRISDERLRAVVDVVHDWLFE